MLVVLAVLELASLNSCRVALALTTALFFVGLGAGLLALRPRAVPRPLVGARAGGGLPAHRAAPRLQLPGRRDHAGRRRDRRGLGWPRWPACCTRALDPGAVAADDAMAESSRVGCRLLQRGAQLVEGPGQQPGDVHLGDADLLGDLRLGHVLEEPEQQDPLLPGVQPVEERLDRLADLDVLEVLVVDADRVEHGRRAVLGVVAGVQRERRVGVARLDALEDLLDRAADPLGQLARRGERPSSWVSSAVPRRSASAAPGAGAGPGSPSPCRGSSA